MNSLTQGEQIAKHRSLEIIVEENALRMGNIAQREEKEHHETSKKAIEE